MNIQIKYKQQCKAVDSSTPLSNNDEAILDLKTILDTFSIPHNDRSTVLVEYPKVKLREIDDTIEYIDDIIVEHMNPYGCFSCKANFDDEDIGIAVILSDAVYQNNPIEFAPDAPYPYLLALTTKKIDSYDDETLWVAFRRTTNTKDILTDLIVNTTLSISGMVHHGFSKRAFEFPHDRFAYETYQNNAHKRLILTSHSLDGNSNSKTLVDLISKKLSKFSSNSQKFTDENISRHFMKNYISSLKSCNKINCEPTLFQQSQLVNELKEFNPIVKSASAIGFDTDVKITTKGSNLYFISSHKSKCLLTSAQLFEDNSIFVILTKTREELVLFNDQLVLADKRTTVAPQINKLATHFGEIDLPLHIKDFGTEQHINTFTHLLETHFSYCSNSRNDGQPITVNETLHVDMKDLINNLHETVSQMPNYSYDKPFIQRASEHPLLFIICGIGILIEGGVVIECCAFGTLRCCLINYSAAVIEVLGGIQASAMGIVGLGTSIAALI
ncbi:unnamed protein product [Didymodactylos carnosus]|uniref:Uncharacterized protein n=1 Tax=Didymodactylos carnosus TaxID=1234261 RepID=A0A815RRH1_9BILA|nr:unnamed protein product [Didymodactylos carnosus]CAF4344109.1 unnamed protein product [Didymodactylos carnosus]